MPCPKCTGLLIDEPEGLRCLNCGACPVAVMPQRAVGRPVSGPGSSARAGGGGKSNAASRRERLKKAGLCTRCGLKRERKAVKGKTLCEEHEKQNRKAVMAWYREKKTA